MTSTINLKMKVWPSKEAESVALVMPVIDLVRAALAHRESKPRGPIERISAAALFDRPWPSPTDRLIEDAVGQALDNAIALIGKRLFAIGGDDAMHFVFDLVEEAHPTSSREAVYLDHRWDNIGDWHC